MAAVPAGACVASDQGHRKDSEKWSVVLGVLVVGAAGLANGGDTEEGREGEGSRILPSPADGENQIFVFCQFSLCLLGMKVEMSDMGVAVQESQGWTGNMGGHYNFTC